MDVAIAKHPKSPTQQYQYGTAGFRLKANLLDAVVFRMGCLAVLRSQSHREEIAQKETIDSSIKGLIVIGRDTRPSSPELVQAAIGGINAMGGDIFDLGIVSTPQVHFAVRQRNKGQDGSEEAYFRYFADAFHASVIGSPSSEPSLLIIDGANGVGAEKARQLSSLLDSKVLSFQVRNSDGKLNYKVGADYVKTSQGIPEGVDPVKDRGKRFASLDGDADRLIYFSISETGEFQMCDGDKIAILFASFLREELEKIQLESEGVNLSLAVVQTAYANGASTLFLTEHLKVEVACTPTGVKHLHHRAVDFDVGIYFEANGHGTITFRENAMTRLETLLSQWEQDPSIASSRKEALRRFVNLPRVINQAVGDALSDVLLVESILRHRQWTFSEWHGMYSDFPNRLRAQKVKDRMKFQTTDAERKLVAPEGLQVQIDQLVNKYPKARSFVRPSGTEDIVRIYAEAETQEAADALAEEVAALVASS